MVSVYQLKPRFQQLLQPLLRALHRAGISANAVTVAAALASGAYGGWLAWAPGSRWAWGLLPAFLLLRMALNALDGMLARTYRQQSALGAILNETGDVVADAALYLPVALLPGVPGWLAVLVVLLATLGELVGVLGQVVGGGRRYDGPCGKSDRAVAFGAVGLLLGLGVPAGPWLAYGLGALALLLAYTVLNRGRQAVRHAPNNLPVN